MYLVRRSGAGRGELRVFGPRGRGDGRGGARGSWVVARCCVMRVRLPSLGLRVRVRAMVRA